jgi:peptidoglycan/xylan/chitin deacetylase (PgdA/CDA1 family)
MKKVYLTVDFEDWYHIPYLRKYEFKNTLTILDDNYNLDQLMNLRDVKFTYFVVGDIFDHHKEAFKKLLLNGNQIGYHTFNHLSLKKTSLEDFVLDIKNAKEKFFEVLKTPYFGFRAPFFSMTKAQYLALIDLVDYDSSIMEHKTFQNSLYNFFELSVNESKLVSERTNKFKEFNLNQINFLGLWINISGGGLFRLLPLFVYKFLVKKSLKRNNTFVLYIHPIDIYPLDLGIEKSLSIIDCFKFRYGRKKAYNKLLKLIDFFKQIGCSFEVMK